LINLSESITLVDIDKFFLALLVFWNCSHEIQYMPMEIRKK